MTFFIEEKLDKSKVEVVSTGVDKVLKDVDLVNRFKAYHKQHAVLRAITKECNLKHISDLYL